MKTNFSTTISDTLQLIKKTYTNQSGLLIQPSHSENSHLLNDLGDYLPFFAYFKQEKFCQTQIQLLPNYLSSTHLLNPRQQFFSIKYNTPYEHSDLILGLFDYYLFTQDKVSLALAQRILSAVIDKFDLSSATSSYYFPSLDLKIPLYDTNDGMYIELFTIAFQITHKKKYLTFAKKLARNTITIMNNNSYQLLPHLTSNQGWLFSGQIKKNFNTITLMKNNTNSIYGLLELYKLTKLTPLKNSILSWAKATKTHFQNNLGGVHSAITINHHHFNKHSVTLTSNFALLDLLCDCYHVLKDQFFLSFATEIANYWLKQQSPTTGLIPLYPQQRDQASYFDSETDMIIALYKLFELTGKKKYSISADKIFHGILQYHRFDQGYYLRVNINSGRVKDKFVKTKFVCLFLKALILYDQPTKKIYGKPQIFQLLKDR